jgi:3-isopropylmalate/(R)-2-methylmalate dehydratase small subunit
MDKFEKFSGIVAGIDRANIDTDAIIPKQYLKSIKRSGFGVNLFDDWRYLDPGEPGQDHSQRRPNPDFVLNLDPYRHAQIILARELMDFGIKVVIAPSFADIFYNNSFKNGLLPIALDSGQVDQLFGELAKNDDYRLEVDLEKQLVTNADGIEMAFEIDEFRKYCLLNGLDDIGLTMQHAETIKAFEEQYYQRMPWLK